MILFIFIRHNEKTHPEYYNIKKRILQPYKRQYRIFAKKHCEALNC